MFDAIFDWTRLFSQVEFQEYGEEFEEYNEDFDDEVKFPSEPIRSNYEERKTAAAPGLFFFIFILKPFPSHMNLFFAQLSYLTVSVRKMCKSSVPRYFLRLPNQTMSSAPRPMQQAKNA